MDTKKLLIPCLIYILALAPRLYKLSETAVYPDEITWMVKGKETIYALKNRNLNYFRNAWWNSRKDTYAIGLPVVVLNGIFHVMLAGEGKFSLKLLPDIIASRLPLVLLGSFTSPLIYWYSTKFLAKQIALLASITYALSPIAIALDRWILHDSALSLFSFLAISTYLLDYKSKTTRFWPGIWLALGFLTKPAGLLPIVSWLTILLIDHSKPSRNLFFKSIIGFIIAATLIWPQSWFKPFMAVPEYLFRQATLTKSGDPIPNFFLGKPTPFPDWTYYLFQLATRTPEIIIVLFLLSLPLYLSKKRPPFSHFLLAIIAYNIVLFLAYSLTLQKGGIRYIMSTIPWIYLVSAWCFFEIIVKLKKAILKTSLAIAYLGLSVYPLLYLPNYYLYYNHFIGGPKNAVKYDLVGLCFGTKPAIKYLDQNKIPGIVSVVGCSDTAPYHTTRNLTKDWKQAEIVILESSYRQQHPDFESVKSVENRKLVQKISENGVITSWIYR